MNIGSFPPTPGIYLPQRGQMIARNADGIRPFGPGTVGQVPTTQANGDVAWQDAGGGTLVAYCEGTGSQGAAWADIPGLSLQLAENAVYHFTAFFYGASNNRQFDLSWRYSGATNPLVYGHAWTRGYNVVWPGEVKLGFGSDVPLVLSNTLDEQLFGDQITYHGLVLTTDPGTLFWRFSKGAFNGDPVSLQAGSCVMFRIGDNQ